MNSLIYDHFNVDGVSSQHLSILQKAIVLIMMSVLKLVQFI